MSSDLFSFAKNHVAVEGGNNPQALLALITGREAASGCCLLESEGRFGSSPAAPAQAVASPAVRSPTSGPLHFPLPVALSPR